MMTSSPRKTAGKAPRKAPRMAPGNPQQSEMVVVRRSDMESIGDCLRDRRRLVNERSVARLQVEVERRVKLGEAAIRIRSVLHREMDRGGFMTRPIDYAEHPDADLWRGMVRWAETNGLTLHLQQRATADTGIAFVVAMPSVEVVVSRLP